MVTSAAQPGLKLRRAQPIISPLADAIFFWGSPLWALAFGLALTQLPKSADAVTISGQSAVLTALFASAITEAHLVIVGFRSHANRTVFKQFPLRFTIVPFALFGAMMLDTRTLILMTLLALLWDGYHSAMQTFGLARIFDARAGADVTRDRKLEMVFNVATYTVPWVLGPTFVLLVPVFEQMWQADMKFLDALVRVRFDNAALFERVVWILVPVSVVLFALRQVQRLRAGDAVSWQKIALLASTTAVAAWCFGSGLWGQGLLVVNLFHAVQYFAIVWSTERKSIAMSARNVLLLIVALGAVYGLFMGVFSKYWFPSMLATTVIVGLRTTVSLMHFWYDGFIWSVRKKHV